MLKQTFADEHATAELRQSLLQNGGALPSRAAAELLPPLVEILLDESRQRAERQRRLYRTAAGLWSIPVGILAFLFTDALTATMIWLGTLATFLALTLPQPGPPRRARGSRGDDSGRREEAALWVAPPSPLQLQAHEAVLALLRGPASHTATRETLPALIQLVEGLERSALRPERRLARAAGAAIRELLPRLLGQPIHDPDILRFLRDRVVAGVYVQPGIAGDVFDLSLFRSPDAGSVYDWDFVVAALLVLGEAGDDGIVPTAEALARRHPFERIRVAATECLRAHREAGR